MKKLTLQISSSYIGSKVKTKEGLIGEIVGLSSVYNSLNIELIDKSISVGHIISECKLILTPLSKITDDDAIKIAKIIMPVCFSNCKNGWLVSRDYTTYKCNFVKVHHPKKVYSLQIDFELINFDIDGISERNTGEFDMQPVAIIDFLRTKHYDCGYGEIKSLIKSGIAIHENNK